MKKINIILALDSKNGLWKDGDLAWRIREDMKYFKQITTDPLSNFPPKGERITQKQNAVIMGRKTWDSIPEKYKPLPGRINAILSRSFNYEDNFWEICKYSSLESSIEHLESREDVEDIFVIGGAQIYNLALQKNVVDTIYLTRVEGDYNCDVFLNIEKKGENIVYEDMEFKSVSKSEWKENKKGIKFRFEVYKRK